MLPSGAAIFAHSGDKSGSRLSAARAVNAVAAHSSRAAVDLVEVIARPKRRPAQSSCDFFIMLIFVLSVDATAKRGSDQHVNQKLPIGSSVRAGLASHSG